MRIAYHVGHRTSPVGKTNELVVQTWGHPTQFELTPIEEKTVGTNERGIKPYLCQNLRLPVPST